MAGGEGTGQPAGGEQLRGGGGPRGEEKNRLGRCGGQARRGGGQAKKEVAEGKRSAPRGGEAGAWEPRATTAAKLGAGVEVSVKGDGAVRVTAKGPAEERPSRAEARAPAGAAKAAARPAAASSVISTSTGTGEGGRLRGAM